MSAQTYFLSTAEAAKHVSLSINTFRKYVNKGIFPAHRVDARLLKFDAAELNAAVKALTK